MNVKTSGAFVGMNLIGANYITEDVQNLLNGLSLHQAQQRNIILADKFEEVNKAFTYGDGHVEDHSHVELVTDKGNIVVSTTLGKELEAWEDRLGDLVFKSFMTDPKKTGGRPSVRVFRLQKPGGGVNETRTDLQIGQ